MQNFTPIEHMKLMFWTNQIFPDLRLRWVSDGYPLMYKDPEKNGLILP